MDEKTLADQLFFAKEAAEYLGITAQRLNKLVQEEKVKPIKKSASGTIFHLNELNRRKEELEIFTKINQGGGNGMFVFDTKVKREALNFATLMNVLNYTEHKLEPLFVEFSKKVNVDIPIKDSDVCEEYTRFFNVNKDVLLKEYDKAYKAFLTLRETDEVIKRGSPEYPPLLAKTEQAPRYINIKGKNPPKYD